MVNYSEQVPGSVTSWSFFFTLWTWDWNLLAGQVKKVKKQDCCDCNVWPWGRKQTEMLTWFRQQVPASLWNTLIWKMDQSCRDAGMHWKKSNSKPSDRFSQSTNNLARNMQVNRWHWSKLLVFACSLCVQLQRFTENGSGSIAREILGTVCKTHPKKSGKPPIFNRSLCWTSYGLIVHSLISKENPKQGELQSSSQYVSYV